MKKRLQVLAIALIFGLSLFFGGAGLTFARVAMAYDPDTDIVFKPSSMGLENGNFDNASGGLPKTPSGWTGAAAGSHGSTDGVIAGAIDLTMKSFLDNYDEIYKLDKENGYYDANSADPKKVSPSTLASDSPNALLINNTLAKSYAYKSGSLTLGKNQYYKIRVNVLTCNFDKVDGTTSQNYGAYIRLGGDIVLSSGPIDTDFEWRSYDFILKGSDIKSQTVTLSLQVGDDSVACPQYPENGYYPTKGFAIFDEITATEISRDLYETYTGMTHPNIIFNEALPSEPAIQVDNNDFEHQDLSGWTYDGTPRNAFVFAANTADFEAVKTVSDKITRNPMAPLSQNDSNVLMISSKTDAVQVYGQVKSSDILIQRHRYYRISAWVNTKDLINGSAYLKLASEDIKNPDGSVAAEGNVSQEISSFGTPIEDSWMGNWVQASFYVAGSTFADRTLNLYLIGGKPDAKMEGAVYFDNIQIQYITASEYTASSADGTTVTFTDVAGTPTVTNGGFNVIGDYTKYAYPLAPKDWTIEKYESGDDHDEDSTDHAGHDKDDAYNQALSKTISGVVPVDKDHFEAHRSDYGNAVNPAPSLTPKNMLMIYNKLPTFYGYSSAAVTTTVDAYQNLTVRLATQLDPDSYGATLVLKSTGNIIAKIENIDTYGAFFDYTFVVKSGAFAQDLSLQILLGEDSERDEKQASGYLWVDNVQLTTSSQSDFTAGDRKALFGFGDENFEYFEKSESGYMTPRTMEKINGKNAPTETIVGGIIDMVSYQEDDYNIIGLTQMFDGYKSKNALLLHSLDNTAFGYKNKFAIQYTADTFSKVTVRLKTLNVQKDKGARILLDKYTFEHIDTQRPKILTGDMTSQLEFVNGEWLYKGWMEYSFYINVGSASTMTSQLSVWLGDESKISKFASGTVLVDQITITKIDESEFTEKTAILDAKDEDTIPENVQRIILSETSDDGEGDGSEPPKKDNTTMLWLIPTLLFGVAIIVAIIGFTIRKLAPKAKAKRAEKISYDRNRKPLSAQPQKTAAVTGGPIFKSDLEPAKDLTDFDEDVAPAAPAVKAAVSEQQQAEDLTAAPAQEEATAIAETEKAEPQSDAEEKATEDFFDDSAADLDAAAAAEEKARIKDEKLAKREAERAKLAALNADKPKDFDSFDD